jgi:hypothetical protein
VGNKKSRGSAYLAEKHALEDEIKRCTYELMMEFQNQF